MKKFSLILNNYIFFITGFKLGNRSISKGYLSGLIMGLSNVLLMVLLGIIFRSIPGITSIIYYSTLILSSVIGGMFGINRKGSPL